MQYPLRGWPSGSDDHRDRHPAQGQITATGVETAPNFFKAAITGGTDRYDTVGGDVLVRFYPRFVRMVYDVDDLG